MARHLSGKESVASLKDVRLQGINHPATRRHMIQVMCELMEQIIVASGSAN